MTTCLTQLGGGDALFHFMHVRTGAIHVVQDHQQETVAIPRPQTVDDYVRPIHHVDKAVRGCGKNHKNGWEGRQSINQSSEQSINQAINQSINQAINQSINQANNQSINHALMNGMVDALMNGMVDLNILEKEKVVAVKNEKRTTFPWSTDVAAVIIDTIAGNE